MPYNPKAQARSLAFYCRCLCNNVCRLCIRLAIEVLLSRGGLSKVSSRFLESGARALDAHDGFSSPGLVGDFALWLGAKMPQGISFICSLCCIRTCSSPRRQEYAALGHVRDVNLLPYNPSALRPWKPCKSKTPIIKHDVHKGCRTIRGLLKTHKHTTRGLPSYNVESCIYIYICTYTKALT